MRLDAHQVLFHPAPGFDHSFDEGVAIWTECQWTGRGPTYGINDAHCYKVRGDREFL